MPQASPASSSTKKPKRVFQLYKQMDGQWRWRLKSRNGKLIANGGEAFKSLRGVLSSIKGVMQINAETPIVDAKGHPFMADNQSKK